MLLLFTEAGQLTFPEQKYSWETGVGNLEGKRRGCKGRNAENKCFSPQVSVERPSSYFLSPGMEETETPRGWESLPRRELESELLSCQARVFPQFGNNIIFSEGKRQQ